MPLSRPNAATPVARTRKRRMTKLPWKRPPVVLADRITVGKRDPPDCALAPAGAASSASETRGAGEGGPAGLCARARRGGEQRERDESGGDGDVSAFHGGFPTYSEP